MRERPKGDDAERPDISLHQRSAVPMQTTMSRPREATLSTSAAQLQFAAEFAAFLVCVAGLALTLLRSDVFVPGRGLRLAMSLGFAALAAAAFLHGSLAVDGPDDARLVALRATGIVLVGLGWLRWKAGVTSGAALGFGLAAFAGAEVATAADRLRVADWTRGAGAFLLGLALILAARSSIPARIAASAAALLLGVVLAVSIALSVVIANNIEDGAVRRFGAPASRPRRRLASDAGVTAFGNARARGRRAAPERRGGRRGRSNLAAGVGTPDDTAQLVRDLTELSEDLRRARSPARPDGGGHARERCRRCVRRRATTRRSSRSPATRWWPRRWGAGSGGSRPSSWAAGASASPPSRSSSTGRCVGAAVVTTMLDTSYLQVRSAGARGEIDGFALTLATPDGVLASDGPQPRPAQLAELARGALDERRRLHRVRRRPVPRRPARAVGRGRAGDGDRRVRARPRRSTRPARTCSASFSSWRWARRWPRSLLAALVGERIGAGLRRLTAAAAEIRHGNLDASAEGLQRGRAGRAQRHVRLDDRVAAGHDRRAAHRGRRRGPAARPARGRGRRHGRGARRRRRPRRRHRLQRGGRGAARRPRPQGRRPAGDLDRVARRRRRDRPHPAAGPPGPRAVDRGGERSPTRRWRGPRRGVGRYASWLGQRGGRRRVRVPGHPPGARGGADEDRVPRQHQPRAAHAAHADQGLRRHARRPRDPARAGQAVRGRDRHGRGAARAHHRPARQLRHDGGRPARPAAGAGEGAGDGRRRWSPAGRNGPTAATRSCARSPAASTRWWSTAGTSSSPSTSCSTTRSSTRPRAAR